MADAMRRGSTKGFWNAAVISAGAVSPGVQVGRGTNMFTFFVSASATSTFALQIAHVGNMTADGVLPDPDVAPGIWHDAWYLGTAGVGNSTPITINGTGAYAIASIVPDFEPDWARLKCTVGTTVTVTAGWEAWGD